MQRRLIWKGFIFLFVGVIICNEWQSATLKYPMIGLDRAGIGHDA